MNPTQRRAAAAQELVRATDGMRIAGLTGTATKAHRDRVAAAERAWDDVKNHGEAAA